jgi:NAD-dependent dihydropyrimidine dehydrogenase PreA subunit
VSFLKYLWGFFFRLFPCPTHVGLRRVGNPGRDSPVLVTCNFHLTVQRLIRKLTGVDAWLLVAQSRGVNVWCAAGGEELDTRSVVSAVKTSGVADLVDHRILILPPLGAPGISLVDVEDQTGWMVRWGPVRAGDLPAFLSAGKKRTEAMKRVTFDWRERLDAGIGSLFPFYFLGAVGFLIFGPHLVLDYLVVSAAMLLTFLLAVPWIPTTRGLTKVLLVNIPLAVALVVTEALDIRPAFALRADLIIAMVSLLVYGTELGGIASNQPSDLDPALARLGIARIGNVAFAGTVRTDLLIGTRKLAYVRKRCIGCRSCEEICPQGVWEMDGDKKAVMAHLEACTACRACLVQCRSGAIQAQQVGVCASSVGR